MATIERLTTHDAERLRMIRLRALRDAPYAYSATYEETAARPPESWTRQLEELATFVAVEEGRDIGLVRVGPHDSLSDAGLLLSMWVAPEARGRGVGVALIDAVANCARSAGLLRLVLGVDLDNAHALALYRRAGFVAIDEPQPQPPHEHEREIQLALML